MEHIRSSSTMWRATCSFPTYKSDIYRDYVRAQLKDIDILEYKHDEKCRKVDYINIRGFQGWKVTVPFWQVNYPFHIDSSSSSCEFNARSSSIGSEDNFGYYETVNSAFRCTGSSQNTTQYWFGGNISHNSYA